MAGNVVDVIVRLVDQFTNRMQKINQSMQQMQQQGQQTASVFTMLQAGLAGISVAAVYQGLKQVAEGFYEIAEAGAQFERVQKAFALTTTDLGENWTTALGNMRAASRGTISDLELMTSANKAFALGVAQSSDQLAQLIQISTVLGRRTGLSQEQSLERLLVGIGRLSPRILDDLGIAINLSRTYREELGKAGSEATQQEKIQAVLNRVIEEGAHNLELYGNNLEDNASQFERFGAQWANLKAELARGAIFQEIGDVAGASAFTMQMQRVSSEAKDGRASIAELVYITEQLAAKQKEVEAQNWMPDWLQQMSYAQRELNYFNELLADAIDKQSIYQSQLDQGPVTPPRDYEREARDAGEALTRLQRRYEELQQVISASAVDSTGVLKEQADTMAGAWERAVTGMVDKYNDAAIALGKQEIDLPTFLATGEFVAQKQGYDLIDEAQEKAKESADALGKSEAEVARIIREATPEYIKLADAMMQRAQVAGRELMTTDRTPEAANAVARMNAELEGELYYLRNIAAAWMSEEELALAVSRAYENASQNLSEYNKVREEAVQQAAAETLRNMGGAILDTIPQLQAAIQGMNDAMTTQDLFAASSQIDAIKQSLVTLGTEYNKAAALAGIQLIDIDALQNGEVAAYDAKAALDLLNNTQALVPTYAQLAGNSLDQEAAAFQVFTAAVAGARIQLMTTIGGFADVLDPTQMKDMFAQGAPELEASIQKIMNSTGSAEDKYFDLMGVIQGVNGGFEEQVQALRDVDKGAGKLANTLESKLKSAYDALNSVVSGELNKSLNVLSDLGVDLNEKLPYKDQPAENARRLAAIMQEGVKGQPWLEEFKNEVPDVFNEIMASSKPQEAAASILDQFQKGLRPELIDWDALKQQIKDNIEMTMRLEGMGKQLTDELIAEMGDDKAGTIAKFVAKTLGTGLDEGFGEDSAAKLMAQFASPEFKSQMYVAGTAGAENWALGFNDKAPEYLAPFIDLIVAYVTPRVAAQQQAVQSTTQAK